MKYLFFIVIITLVLWAPANLSAQWSQTNSPSISIKCLATFGINLYGGFGTIYRSTDNGISWIKPTYGTSGGNYAIATIDSLLFVGTDGRGVYRSTDSGATWSRVINGLNDSKDQYIWGLGVSGRSVFALSQFGGAVRSVDYGENWTSTNGLPQPKSIGAQVHTILTISKNLLAGTDSGLFISSDTGANWVAMNSSLKNTSVTTLVQSGTSIYAGTYSGVFRSSDGGSNWVQLNSDLNNRWVQALVVNGTSLFAGTIGSGIFQSDDSSATWKLMSKDLPDSNITTLALNDKYLFAGTLSTGIWRFPLDKLNAVDQKPAIEQELVLYPNYPNPVIAQTTISFSTDKREFIDMSIFDLLGNKSEHLYSGEIEAGKHSCEWDASHFSPSTYLCIIRSGDGHVIEMPIIVKH